MVPSSPNNKGKQQLHKHPLTHNSGYERLLGVCAQHVFEPHDIAANLDSRGHYELELDKEFPFVIKLFHFSSQHHTRGGTWHERLELFTPLDGPTRFRMGDREVVAESGEVLVVDNLKLHQVVDFKGFDTRVVVISFLPEFVYSLGSPSHDYAFLLPFYSKVQNQSHLLRQSDEELTLVHEAMSRLLNCYFDRANESYYQAGCKAFLLELLYHLARRFRTSETLRWEFMRQQQRSLNFKKLFHHISVNFGEKLSIGEAATMVGMSESKFMRSFKEVAGMTLVSYLNHVRLSNGLRLLKESDMKIAEIAAAVGFSDQSYFDRQFRKAFGVTPRSFRGGTNTDESPLPRRAPKE